MTSLQTFSKYSLTVSSAIPDTPSMLSYGSSVLSSRKHVRTSIYNGIPRLPSTTFLRPQYCDINTSRSGLVFQNNILGTSNRQRSKRSGYTQTSMKYFKTHVDSARFIFASPFFCLLQSRLACRNLIAAAVAHATGVFGDFFAL